MRRATIVIGLLCLTASLAACSVSLTGGIVGGLLTVLVGIGLLAVGTTSQSGCGGIIGPCLSPVPPPPQTPTSSTLVPRDAAVDAGAQDAQVPPVPPAEPASRDTHLQVCLSEMPIEDAVEPPVGPCLAPPRLSPCLKLVPPQGMLDTPPDEAAPLDRAAIKARLIAQGALPADVVDRLS